MERRRKEVSSRGVKEKEIMERGREKQEGKRKGEGEGEGGNEKRMGEATGKKIRGRRR